MKKEAIHVGRGGSVEVTTFLDDPLRRNDYLQSVIENIPRDKSIGYAGYCTKAALKSFLQWSIFGGVPHKTWQRISSENVAREIGKVIQLCDKFISKKKMRVFVFPTFSSFTFTKMNGVGGHTPWKDTIILNVSAAKGWQRALRETFAHELAHAIQLRFCKRKTLLDDIVFEGVAEHFREHFVGGGKAKWVKCLSKVKSRAIFKTLMTKLSSTDDNLSCDVFFGNNNYPMWTGYAIGYYLVEGHLEKKKQINWKKIMRTPLMTIMQKSSFVHE